MRIRTDRFVIAIIVVIAIAWLFPQPGRSNSPVPLDLIGSIGISLIFFFYGLKLSREKMMAGLKNWKLHVLVQTSTFILFPLIVLPIHRYVHSEHGYTIWLAFLFLAALPSTVSSSVVMVSVAKGNVPAAIFNASISGLIGIVITPLWMGPFLAQWHVDFDFSEIYLKLAVEILGPLVLGLLLQPRLGNYAQQYIRQLGLFDKAIILLIVYKSFAESFEQRIFQAVQPADLINITVGVLAIFFFVYYLIGFAARWLGFTREDRIAAQFCGTKKSLVHGTVFSKILFQGSGAMGMILLPLMLFHALQVFIISIIASRLADDESRVES